MRITHIESVRNRKPIALPEPWRPAWNEPDVRDQTTTSFAFIKVHTDEGITGIGPYTGDASGIGNALIGQDPTYIGRFWEQHMRGKGAVFGTNSMGGIEIALWDIVGKAAGLPIYRLLGACRDKVLAYAATAQLKSPQESADLAVEFRARGIKAIKLRLHRADPQEDLAVVAAVRKAIGNDMHILVDANQNNLAPSYPFWDRATAIKVARQLQDLDVYWLEEPLPRSDLSGLAEMCRSLDMNIVGGEHCPTFYEFRDALFAGAYDMVQPDVVLGNIGISGIRRIATLAEAVGRQVVPHVCGGGNNGFYLAATLQALGTVSNCPFIEYTLDPPALTHETLQVPLKDKILMDDEGYVRIPDKPGLGIELDTEAIAEYL